MPEDVTLVIKAIDSTKEALASVANNIKNLESQNASIVQKMQNAWMKVTGAFAAVGAAVIGLSEAFRMAEQAAGFEEQMELMNRFANAYGMTADQVVDGIKKASDGLVSLKSAAETANSAMQKGLSADQVINLANAAKVLSDYMGVTADEAFQKLSESITTAREKTIKLGVGVIDLSEKYGTMESQLTDAGKMQAYYNIVMEETARIEKMMEGQTESTADKIERLKVQMEDLRITVGDYMLRAFMAFIGVLQYAGGIVLWLTGGVFGLISAMGKLTDFLGITQNLAKEYETAKKAATEGAEDLFKQGGEKITTALTATNYEMGAPVSPPRQKPTFKPTKSNLLSEWKKTKNDLEGELENVDLSPLDAKINDFETKAEDLRTKFKTIQESSAVINKWLEGMKRRVEKERTEKISELEHEITKELANEMDKRILDVDKWTKDEIKKVTETVNNTEEAEALKTKIYEAAAKKKKQIIDETNKYEQEALIEIKLLQIDIAEAEQSMPRKEAIKQRIDAYNELLQIQKQWLDEIGKSGDREAFIKQEEAVERTRLSIAQLTKDMLTYTGTFSQGFSDIFDDYMDKVQSAFERGKDFASAMISDLTTEFTDFLDYSSDKFMNFGSLISDVVNSVYKELMKILVIQPLVGWITSGLGTNLGGIFGHEGGIVTKGGIMRFHAGGLAGDEVPAVLQTGERVLSRSQNKMFDSMVSSLQSLARQPSQTPIQIVNVIDPKEVGNYLATPDGQKMVLNIISSKAGKVRKILGG